jgi:hypothetical protein
MQEPERLSSKFDSLGGFSRHELPSQLEGFKKEFFH